MKKQPFYYICLQYIALLLAGFHDKLESYQQRKPSIGLADLVNLTNDKNVF